MGNGVVLGASVILGGSVGGVDGGELGLSGNDMGYLHRSINKKILPI
jgi:hypothetical protein